MGRASGKQNLFLSAIEPGKSAAPRFEDYIRRVASWNLDVEVIAAGTLDAEQEGHPAGTPFVTIATNTALGREIARQDFAGYCSTTELAWEYGWTPVAIPGGRGHFKALILYPSADRYWGDSWILGSLA